MNFKMALFFFLVAISDLSHALYGGRVLNQAALDAVVSIHLNDADKPEYDFFCSGVLVAPDKVLTTGHCVEVMATEVYEQWNLFGYEPGLLKVKIKGVKVDVADVVLAPSYTEASGFEGEDLAIIKLKKPVANVKPLRLFSKSALKVNMPVSLVAKGKIADTTIKSLKTYGNNLVIYTDGSRAGACQGDSGGALVVKSGAEYYLAGVLSAQWPGCVRQTGVSIFARKF